MVGKYLGYLLLAEGVFLLPSVVTAITYGETGPLFAFLATIAICWGLGGVLYLLLHNESAVMYPREGFVVAGLGWIIVSAAGALPFVISGEIPHYVDALFESVSGFTTTGASILVEVERMSKSLIFWRSFTHWLGGIGVLAFILAVVRAKSGAGFTLHLLRAESPGPQVGKIMPKTRESVRSLFLIYGGLSLANLLFLLMGGMSLFDALCTMFGTAGTGGFGIKNDSMASYSAYLQNVTTVFMALFGVNFTLFHLTLRREWRAALRDEELRLYVGTMLFSIGAIAVSLYIHGFGGIGASLHHSAFTTSSIMTTTGYTTANYDLWPPFTRSLILILMIGGAMAGSTGGGFKMVRVLILLKSMKIGLHRLIHPRSVKRVQINGKTLDEDVMARNNLFLVVYCFTVIAVFLLVSLDDLSMETDLSATLSCFNNIGPALAQAGPALNYNDYSYFSKGVLTLAMLLGRLEIFPILLLFVPSTWRHKI